MSCGARKGTPLSLSLSLELELELDAKRSKNTVSVPGI